MKEIKYKAWSKLDKRFYPIRSIIFDDEHNIERIIVLKEDNGVTYLHDILAPLFTLLQFTGFDDIARNEIYEGCLLRDLEHPNEKEPGEVFFHPLGYWALRYTYSDGMVDDDTPLGSYADESCVSAYEVIGNIYENPELLGKSVI